MKVIDINRKRVQIFEGSTIDEKELRSERNKDLVERTLKGEKISYCDASDTWFPERPTIKKDKALVKRLYND
jgi:hypothetical protein